MVYSLYIYRVSINWLDLFFRFSTYLTQAACLRPYRAARTTTALGIVYISLAQMQRSMNGLVYESDFPLASSRTRPFDRFWQSWTGRWLKIGRRHGHFFCSDLWVLWTALARRLSTTSWGGHEMNWIGSCLCTHTSTLVKPRVMILQLQFVSWRSSLQIVHACHEPHKQSCTRSTAFVWMSFWIYKEH